MTESPFDQIANDGSDTEPIGQDDNDNDNAEHPSRPEPMKTAATAKYTETWWRARNDVGRCTADKSDRSARCGKPAMDGQRVCGTHGGRAPQAKRKARQCLEEAADRMARELLKIAESSDDERVCLAAIRDTLDRVGITARTAVEIEVSAKPFEQIAESAATTLEITSRAEFRRAQGTEDDESDADDPLAGLYAADVAKATADESRRRDAIRYGASDSNVIDAETVEIDGDVIDYGHTITPGDYEREPTRLGVPTLDPLTGRPAFDPADFDGPMTSEQANDVVAEINRRNAERVQRERRDAGRAVVHPVRRALPRGRSS